MAPLGSLERLYEDQRTVAGHRVTVNFTATIPVKALIYVERTDGIVLLCWTGTYPSVPEIYRDAAARIAHTTQGGPVSIHPPPAPIGDPEP